ncbi:MAG: MraY family glycosyltransferase [Thermodesulfobacteriota bacterium]|nr:MraY family glycosyltransferase [Thermodesulfobacteriota bacterium]
MIYFTTLLLSLFITSSLIPLLKGCAVKMNVLDMPDERKAHLKPMPKMGGIAMALGAVLPVLFWIEWTPFTRSILLGAGIIVCGGFIDDLNNLSYKKKFFIQFIAACLVVFHGKVVIKSFGMLLPEGMLTPDFVAIPFTLIVIIGVTNAINLADGLDGLAGGISLLSFLCIGYLGHQGGYFEITLISLAIGGAIFGFLRFNTYPAIVFMGDAGSQLLGFLVVTLSLALTQTNAPLSPVLPLLIIGFPILDTLAVMSERMIHKKSPFSPDKNHFHHKFMRLGFYHTEAVFVIYLLQAFLVTTAFVLRFYSDWLLLIFYLIFSGVILGGFWFADVTCWQFTRIDFLDKIIKGRLKVLKEKNILIKISFRLLKISIPLLLFFTCFLPAQISRSFAFFTIFELLTIAITAFAKKAWLTRVVHILLFFLIPITVYQSEVITVSWLSGGFLRFYNLFFLLLVVFVTFTLKFTLRRKGFKTSTLDFLILFIALVVPNLPDPRIQSYHMGLLATKIVIFFFSYEVLIGELRNDNRWLTATTSASLLVIAIRGLAG